MVINSNAIAHAALGQPQASQRHRPRRRCDEVVLEKDAVGLTQRVALRGRGDSGSTATLAVKEPVLFARQLALSTNLNVSG